MLHNAIVMTDNAFVVPHIASVLPHNRIASPHIASAVRLYCNIMRFASLLMFTHKLRVELVDLSGNVAF
jgi:hypothetical protein